MDELPTSCTAAMLAIFALGWRPALEAVDAMTQRDAAGVLERADGSRPVAEFQASAYRPGNLDEPEGVVYVRGPDADRAMVQVLQEARVRELRYFSREATTHDRRSPAGPVRPGARVP